MIYDYKEVNKLYQDNCNKELSDKVENILRSKIIVKVTNDMDPHIKYHYSSGCNSFIQFNDGTLIKYWSANQWYSFGSSGEIHAPDGHITIWSNHNTISQKVACMLADVYCNKDDYAIKEGYRLPDRLFKCFCGASVSKVETKSGPLLRCDGVENHITDINSFEFDKQGNAVLMENSYER